MKWKGSYEAYLILSAFKFVKFCIEPGIVDVRKLEFTSKYFKSLAFTAGVILNWEKCESEILKDDAPMAARGKGPDK